MVGTLPPSLFELRRTGRFAHPGLPTICRGANADRPTGINGRHQHRPPPQVHTKPGGQCDPNDRQAALSTGEKFFAALGIAAPVAVTASALHASEPTRNIVAAAITVTANFLIALYLQVLGFLPLYTLTQGYENRKTASLRVLWAPGVPHALCFERRAVQAQLGRPAPRECERVCAFRGCLTIESGARRLPNTRCTSPLVGEA